MSPFSPGFCYSAFLFSELERMGFSAVSGSYEYCILDSLASQNTDHYVTLIEMEVKKKG